MSVEGWQWEGGDLGAAERAVLTTFHETAEDQSFPPYFTNTGAYNLAMYFSFGVPAAETRGIIQDVRLDKLRELIIDKLRGWEHQRFTDLMQGLGKLCNWDRVTTSEWTDRLAADLSANDPSAATTRLIALSSCALANLVGAKG